MRAIKSLDLFPKTAPEVKETTSACGGLLSLLIICLMSGLFLSECADYLFSAPIREVSIEPYEEDRRIRFDLNISLFKVPCEALAMDYEDSMGSHFYAYTLKMLRLDASGQIINAHQAQDLRLEENTKISKKGCGSCYGAELHESQCCNTCDEVIDAYSRKGWQPPDKRNIDQCRRKLQGFFLSGGGGCQIYGHLLLKEVPGAIHISLAPLGQMLYATGGGIDLSHALNHLQATDSERGFVPEPTPATSPLDGTSAYGHTHYQYYLKLTSARSAAGLRFFETTGHSSSYVSDAIPTLYIKYDIEPITTRYHYRTSFLMFLVSLFAILGGSFACSAYLAKLLG